MPLAPEVLTALITLASSLAAFSILWLVSLRINDASIVDWYWGLGFAVIAWIRFARHEATPARLVVATLVTLWAVRLTSHMIARHLRRGREDARYVAMRTAGGETFKRDSLAKIFLLQAVILWIVATPVHAAILAVSGEVHTGLFAVGVLLFAIGFCIETIADLALSRFSRDPANHGKLLTVGLFAWSRHPNYFGETLVWWGLGAAAFAMSGAWWAFAGPAILTFLLLKVSGVTMTDALMSTRPGWIDYAARTPAFFPRPPRAHLKNREQAARSS